MKEWKMNVFKTIEKKIQKKSNKKKQVDIMSQYYRGMQIVEN